MIPASTTANVAVMGKVTATTMVAVTGNGKVTSTATVAVTGNGKGDIHGNGGSDG